MKTEMVFKRHELKYLMSTFQYQALLQTMKGHMEMDVYGRHAIHNIYFDTPDYLLIRRSLEKPCYKEKLRVRSYGDFTNSSSVFVELKKKYRGIVYKRRLTLPQQEAFDFLNDKKPLSQPCQIGREVSYFMDHYGNLAPAAALHYEREAFFGVEDADFRMTFDHNIKIGTSNVSLSCQPTDVPILPGDTVLLEVKTAMGIPQWLLDFFGTQQIFKTSFSKYGAGYQQYLLPRLTGGIHHVAS